MVIWNCQTLCCPIHSSVRLSGDSLIVNYPLSSLSVSIYASCKGRVLNYIYTVVLLAEHNILFYTQTGKLFMTKLSYLQTKHTIPE